MSGAVTEAVTHVRSTGIGSWAGTDLGAALRIAFAECPDLPYLPELPARGPWAEIIGRGTAVLDSLGIELHPSGWRLTDISGRDHRRAVSTLRSDLDQLEEVAQGYVGPIKIATVGPWTLAAALEHPRGDKVIADRGARRDIAQSLTEGVRTMISELSRRLPQAGFVVQLDEPSLPAVLAGGIRTASGLHRHRAVDIPEVSEVYTALVEQSGAPVWLHSCAPGVPITLLHRAGIGGLLLDLDQLDAAAWDELGPAAENGLVLGLGVTPTTRVVGPDRLAERALGALRPLGLDPAVTTRSLLHPACGLAGARVGDAVTMLRSLRTAAEIVTEQLAE